ncbi:hypothetical protein BpHYR1_022117 [Brachionus plicatilis]|uniref:Uncharacterized protein n=1 Tax=Brachionus plicatilis TaxID=10195 RepID=A0A3M7PYG7_BRAPC|nr:hypothetical protein BpHYR1_022117 [Brachionus plicatilis]
MNGNNDEFLYCNVKNKINTRKISDARIQVDKSAAKANSMLGVLRKTLVSRDAYIWKQMYTTYQLNSAT